MLPDDPFALGFEAVGGREAIVEDIEDLKVVFEKKMDNLPILIELEAEDGIVSK